MDRSGGFQPPRWLQLKWRRLEAAATVIHLVTIDKALVASEWGIEIKAHPVRACTLSMSVGPTLLSSWQIGKVAVVTSLEQMTSAHAPICQLEAFANSPWNARIFRMSLN
jgi:hypothetical protein